MERKHFFFYSMSSTVAAGAMNNLQGVQGQVTRIMRQQYGDNNDRSEYHYQEILNYASKNLALVTIYIREPFTEKILIDQEISVFSFVSDIGGLMGLFMGFSVVSIVEVIYHAFRVS